MAKNGCRHCRIAASGSIQGKVSYCSDDDDDDAPPYVFAGC